MSLIIDYSNSRLAPCDLQHVNRRLANNNPPRDRSASLSDKPAEGPRKWDAALRCWVLIKPDIPAPAPAPVPSVRPRSTHGAPFEVRDRVTGHTLWRIRAHDYKAAREEADFLARANGGNPVDVLVISI